MNECRIPRHRLVGLLAVVLLGLAAAYAPVVGAAGPTIVDETFTVTDVPFGLRCDAFAIRIVTLTVERRRIDFYDDAGTLIREIRHIQFTGTLANTVNGARVPYDGHFTATFDYRAGTLTVTGQNLRVPLPGGGALALTTGRAVVALATGEVPFEVGHTEEEFRTRLCALLAG